MSATSDLPGTLWDEIFTPPHVQHPINAEHFREEAYTNATTGSPVTEVEFVGHSMPDLVRELKGVIEKCGERGDYSLVLAPQRSFVM
jgi:hypothetical protein